MNMEIPVFDLSNLKRQFFYFLAVCLAIALTLAAVRFLTDGKAIRQLLYKIDSWYVIIILVIITYLSNKQSKKELDSILNTENFEEKFRKYEVRYKKRLIWNVFSFVMTAIFVITSNSPIMLYILILQLILLPVYYPRKAIIARELNNDQIVFT